MDQLYITGQNVWPCWIPAKIIIALSGAVQYRAAAAASAAWHQYRITVQAEQHACFA